MRSTAKLVPAGSAQAMFYCTLESEVLCKCKALERKTSLTDKNRQKRLTFICCDISCFSWQEWLLCFCKALEEDAPLKETNRQLETDKKRQQTERKRERDVFPIQNYSIDIYSC